MLSKADSGSFLWQDKATSTLDAIASVGICLGVLVMSKGQEEIYLVHLSSLLFR